jgi:hypothetical protein
METKKKVIMRGNGENLKKKYYAFCVTENRPVGPPHEDKEMAFGDKNAHKNIQENSNHVVDIKEQVIR